MNQMGMGMDMGLGGSSGVTPLTILGGSSVVKGWYDGRDQTSIWADTGRTVQITNGVAVRVWDDKSGNANHLTNASAGVSPIWTSATGKVAFDGVDDYLQKSFTLVQPCEVFGVVDLPAGFTSGTNPRLMDGLADGGMALLQFNGSSTVKIDAFAGSHALFNDNYTVAIQQFRILYSGAGTIARWARGTETTINVGTSSANGLTLGNNGGVFAAGMCNWYECIVTNAAVSAANRVLIETYLSQKWGA